MLNRPLHLEFKGKSLLITYRQEVIGAHLPPADIDSLSVKQEKAAAAINLKIQNTDFNTTRTAFLFISDHTARRIINVPDDFQSSTIIHKKSLNVSCSQAISKNKKILIICFKTNYSDIYKIQQLRCRETNKKFNYKVLLLIILPTVTIHEVTHLCTVNKETMEIGCRFADLDDRFVLGVG